MERVERTTKRSGTVVDARMSLAMWLRAGRAQRSMTIEDVAKVTKIQPRILERLEAGKFDGLPAEVFVRGFVRSFARCVGLDETEALERYNIVVASGGKDPSPTARALVDSMSDLAPRAASRATGPVMLVATPIEVVEVAPDVVETVLLPESGTLMELTTIPASSMDEVKIADVAAAAAVEPVVATPVEPGVATADAAPGPKGKKKRARGGKRKSIATGTPSEATPVVAAAAAAIDDVTVVAVVAVAPGSASSPERPIIGDLDPAIAAIAAIPAPAVAAPVDPDPAPVAVAEAIAGDAMSPRVLEPRRDEADEIALAVTEPWAPKMPPLATTSVPWRRPAMTTTAAPIVPSLVIDDAAPEYAERVLEDRAAAKISTTNAQRRSFLPPILLDREDRSARQGGLTLAVILLLIAATITLSYLMRRPSSSGDGITQADVSTHFVG